MTKSRNYYECHQYTPEPEWLAQYNFYIQQYHTDFEIENICVFWSDGFGEFVYYDVFGGVANSYSDDPQTEGLEDAQGIVEKCVLHVETGNFDDLNFSDTTEFLKRNFVFNGGEYLETTEEINSKLFFPRKYTVSEMSEMYPQDEYVWVSGFNLYYESAEFPRQIVTSGDESAAIAFNGKFVFYDWGNSFFENGEEDLVLFPLVRSGNYLDSFSDSERCLDSDLVFPNIFYGFEFYKQAHTSSGMINNGFIKKEYLSNYLDKLGIEWTYSSNEALNLPVSEWGENVSTPPPNEGHPPENSGGGTTPPDGIGQGESGEGGGTGDGDNNSDSILIPEIPIKPYTLAGNTYAITINQLSEFQNFLWTGTFMQDINMLLESPIENVIGIVYYPFSLEILGALGTDSNIVIGNVDTGVLGTTLDNTFSNRVDMGTFNFTEYFGSFLDYEPYTKISIYLPYIGYRELSPNIVMGKIINLEYTFDLMNGTCVAHIFVGTSLIYEFQGAVGVIIPISGSNANQRAKDMVGASLQLAGAVFGK